MGQSRKYKDWSEDDIRRFALSCFEKAPACLCGCGEKTFPEITKHKISLISWYSKWKKGIDVIFQDRKKGHNYPYHLSDNHIQASIASLLGDGYLSYPNKCSSAPRFSWNMGNKDHALYKANFFKDFGARYSEEENPGWGKNWFRVATGCALAFEDIYKKYRLDDRIERARLIVPLLNEVGWAWYYGDDGYYNKKSESCFFHTEGLGKEGSEIVAKGISDFIGKENSASVYMYLGGSPKKERYLVRIKKNESKEFIKRIKSNMATGMEYKTG